MIRERCIDILKNLALLGALDRDITISTVRLADMLGLSQQSSSRYLIKMEKEGYISRRIGPKRQRVMITRKGAKLLRREYVDYKRIFEREEKIFLKGRATSGLGEGKYYTSIEGYVKQFVEKLGFRPVPGTLNIEVYEDYIDKLGEIDSMRGIEIESFSTPERTYGGATCFPSRINGKKAIAIMPSRSHYSNVIEFIAPYNLREKLNLKDGDEVDIEIDLGGEDEE